MSDYTQRAQIRADLAAAIDPLPIPLRELVSDDPEAATQIVTSHDFTTAPDRVTGPFFDVSDELEAVFDFAPAVYPWGRTATYRIESGFNPAGVFSVTIGGVAITVTDPGATPAQILTQLGNTAVGSTSATGFRVYATTGSTGIVDFYLPPGTVFDAFGATGGNAVSAAVDPVQITEVVLYGRLNDRNVPVAPTRSGWRRYINRLTGCAVTVSSGADGVPVPLDVRSYKWLYPYVNGAVTGVAGDDATALSAGTFRALRIRPCSHTNREVPA